MRKYHRRKLQQESQYKCEPWQVTEEEFRVEANHHNEAIFALGNGYMGVRGTLEEDYSGPSETTTPGIYINGVYGSEEIIYGEEAPDLPERGQTILNLADWTSINLYLEEERFDMLTGRVSNYRRVLNMKEGTLTRELIWLSPGGKKIKIKIIRFLSLTSQHNGIINYNFTPLNFTGRVRLISAIKGDVCNYHHLREKKALDVVDKGYAGNRGYVLQLAPSTGIMVGTAMDNRLELPEASTCNRIRLVEAGRVIEQFELKVEKGKDYNLTKYVCLFSSRDMDEDKVKGEVLKDYLLEKLVEAVETGWQQLLAEQREFLRRYWDSVDVKIYGDISLQQAFRFNAFHLLQSTGRDGRTSIAAKGLTGEFYEGHYFWDTETYVLPFYLYSQPEIARQLLLYRYHTLEEARANARRMKLKGALYPWRTINGEEASGYFMGSTVQYHIDADIAYAIHQYFTATDDYEFLFNYGTEILIETARMWADRGSYIPLKGNKFCFNEVCGPDEYKPGVNNNCYTNYMARFNLEFAVEAVRLMEEKVPDKYLELQNRLGLEESELKKWERIARDIYLPYNEELGIYPQDDSFLFKEPIDVDAIPEEEIPLVKNWHPLVIWRYQVIKQADVILLMLLLGDKFTLTEKRTNYDFYEPKTTHDSSLSPAIYSIIASEIGYYKQAYNYFLQTARLDLDDYNDNAYQGVHTACMASTWMALVQGFAGMRNYNGQLHFNPYLPAGWDGYEFKIKFKGRQLQIKVEPDGTNYQLLRGEELTIIHQGEEVRLIKGINVGLTNRFEYYD